MSEPDTSTSERDTSNSDRELEHGQLHSLDTVFDLTRNQLDYQLSHVDSIDTKAAFIFGSASLLTGLLTAWQVPQVAIHNPTIAKLLALLIVIAYAVVVSTSAVAYFPRTYHNPPDPEKLDGYLKKPQEETKGTVLANMVQAYQCNDKTIERKLCWLQAAFIALVFEVAIVGLILFIETVL